MWQADSRKSVDIEPKQSDHQEATMGGSGLRAHYAVEISVGDAFLDISEGSLSLLHMIFFIRIVLPLCRSSWFGVLPIS